MSRTKFDVSFQLDPMQSRGEEVVEGLMSVKDDRLEVGKTEMHITGLVTSTYEAENISESDEAALVDLIRTSLQAAFNGVQVSVQAFRQ